MTLTIAVVNLKGGSAKTTTTAFLAHAFHALGLKVLVADADPQGQALRWSEGAEWPFPALGMPVKDLHKRLPGVVPPDVDVVLIDTPPLEEQAGVVYSAIRAADVVVISMAPTMSELDRLPDVWAAIDEIGPMRNTEPVHSVLLNRTVANASSTETIRTSIRESGRLVMETAIARREHFAQAFNAPITETWQYADAAQEILTLGRK